MDNVTSTQAITALGPEAEVALKLAPVGEKNDEPDLTKSPEFREFLNKIADFATAQANSAAQWERRKNTVKLRKMVLGEYYGIFDKSRGWVNGHTEGDGLYYDPTVATFIDTLIAQLVKSRPKKVCEARVPEMIDKREAARVAEKLLEIDDDQDYTPKKQQREWKWNLLTGGETYRITYFNPNKPGCGVNEEVFEPKSVESGETAYFCALCGATGASDDGKCVECGNPQVDEYKAVNTTITVNKGSKYRQIGDTDWDVPDCLEMTVVGETDEVGEALIVLRDRLIPRCVLQDALGVKNLPDTEVPDHLTYKQLFDDNGASTMPEFKLLHYQELWVAPAVYASYELPQDTKTKGGDVAPAGSKAKEVFPDGMYFSRVKQEIYNLYPQGAKECISHAVNSIGEGFHGQGEWDLNELGDQLTEAKSMKMNSLLLDSTSPLLVREGVVDPENFENKYGLVIPVGRDSLDDKGGLDGVMRRVPVTGPPEQAYAVGEELKGQAQQRVGAFSTQSDAPDIKAMGTATGTAAIVEQTISRRGPALELYAQMEVDQAYQRLELRQKYWCKKMYSSIATDLGDSAVDWFMKCNIRQDIKISVVEDSWMPRTIEQKRAGLQNYLGIAGDVIVAKGDPKMMDDVIRKANEVFGGGLDLGDHQQENVECQLRLDKLRDVGEFVEQTFGDAIYDENGRIAAIPLRVAYAQTAEMLRIVHEPAQRNGMPDPMDVFGELPLDVMFDEHSEFTENYTDWLKTAEGRAASPFIRTLVRELADYHLQAEAYRQLKLNSYSKVPMIADVEAEIIAGEAMQEAQPEDTTVQDAQNADMMKQNAEMAKMDAQTQAKQQEQVLNLADKEREREHQLELKEMDVKKAA